MTKGNVVVVSFPFTNLQGTKRRPAVVLYAGEKDITLCFITSRIFREEENDLLIEPDQENRLKRASLIRTDKIATLEKALVAGKIGELSKSDIERLNEKLKRLLQLD